MQKKTDVHTIIKVMVRELQATEYRLEILERRNRRWARLCLFCFLLLIALAALLVSPYKTITAKQFLVSNEEGDCRIIVGPTAITFLNQKSFMRARLGLGLEGFPILSFFDDNEKVRSSIGSFENGDPRISLFDQSENCRAFLGIDPSGLLTISLFDEKGIHSGSFGFDPQLGEFHPWSKEVGSVPIRNGTSPVTQE